MGKPYWTEHEKEYFLKRVLPRSCFVTGYFEEGTGDSLEDLAKEMQEYLDRRGFSKRTYSSDNLYQHWYQKVRPRDDNNKSIRTSEISQGSFSNNRSRNITNKSLRSSEATEGSSSASPTMRVSIPFMAGPTAKATEKGKGKAKSSEPGAEDEHNIKFRDEVDGEDEGANSSEGIIGSSDKQIENHKTSNALNVLADLAASAQKLPTSPVTSDGAIASATLPIEGSQPRSEEEIVASIESDAEFTLVTDTHAGANSSKVLIDGPTPNSGKKKRTLSAETSKGGDITTSAKKAKTLPKNYRRPSVEEEDGADNYLLNFPYHTQGAITQSCETVKRESSQRPGMSSSNIKPRKTLNGPFNASGAGQEQAQLLRGVHGHGYTSPYGPHPSAAVPTHQPAKPSAVSGHAHKYNFPPGALEKQFHMQGHPRYPLPYGGGPIRGGAPQARHPTQAPYPVHQHQVPGQAPDQAPGRAQTLPPQPLRSNQTGQAPGPNHHRDTHQHRDAQQYRESQEDRDAQQLRDPQTHVGTPRLGVVVLPHCPACNRRFV